MRKGPSGEFGVDEFAEMMDQEEVSFLRGRAALLIGNWIFRGIGSGRGVYLRVVGIVDFVEVNGEA